MGSTPENDGQATDISPFAAPDERTLRSFLLRVVAGPDVGKTLAIDPTRGRVLLGQSPACTLGSTTAPSRAVTPRWIPRQGRSASTTSARPTAPSSTASARRRDPRAAARRSSWAPRSLGSSRTRRSGSAATSHALRPSSSGASDEIRRLYPLIERIAASDIPVVIEGETGTGKEVLAESLHEASPRRSGPFVVFDCTTVTATLMEADALRSRARRVHRGDRVARPAFSSRPTGARCSSTRSAIWTSPCRPSSCAPSSAPRCAASAARSWMRVDVRVIAATRRDLDREVQAGRFRDDLFFRLAVARIELPPLRRRRKDVALLAARFWKEIGGPSAAPHRRPAQAPRGLRLAGQRPRAAQRDRAAHRAW